MIDAADRGGGNWLFFLVAALLLAYALIQTPFVLRSPVASDKAQISSIAYDVTHFGRASASSLGLDGFEERYYAHPPIYFYILGNVY
jgi:hypothetical protein